ncbi:undecaprenyl/decaprenyl-phosphate alpha-N-acetylglucosaminyl 1-phosphate transferase, partial [Alphaproteobacteria bacterium]|nr:undecaprenyl/decaprenyl-phosphate alpha-N-acetylglucosaminyl 1-phosphate transferase [Alphaproteobacteria bacterium]
MKRLCIIDQPNHRSSHVRAVPRSGGVAIVITTYAGVGLVFLLNTSLPTAVFQVLGIGIAGMILAVAGLLDDLDWLSSFKYKLALQALGCCVLFAFGLVLKTLPLPIVGEISLGWLGYPITFLWVLGLTNIFNFMDGLDGLAAGTAMVVAVLIVLLVDDGPLGSTEAICFVLSAATLGFFIFNFPRANIFLGDVGSQFLGFVFASVAVLAADYDPTGVPILIIPLLLFHFIFDTIFTFSRRLFARENVTLAHRSHLYQLLNQTGMSHAWVSVIHFVIALAQGGGAYAMLQFPENNQWVVFLPFL